MKKTLTLVCLLLIASLAFAQQHKLSLDLEVGKEYQQMTTSQMEILQEISGQNIDINLNIDGLMSYKVKEASENAYTFDVVYKRMGMKMVMPQMTMDFNSTSGKDDPFSKMLKAIVDQPFQVVMAKNGKILEVKNLEAIFESSISQFEELPAAQLEQIKSQLSQSYGADAFKGNIEMVTAIFPDEKVSVGDSWKVDTKLKSGFEAGINSTYTLVEKKDDYYTIKGDAGIETEDTEEMTQMNGFPMRFDMTGKMVSTIKVDSKTGWIIEANVQQGISGDAFIGEPGSGNDMVSKMKMNGEFKITNGN